MNLKRYHKKDFKVGETVLMRVDLNLPMLKGKISTNIGNRVDILMPEIKKILQYNVKVVLLSHLGRPHGKYVDSLSLKPIAKIISKNLKKKIIFLEYKNKKNWVKIIKSSDSESIFLLDNLRFFSGEEVNNKKFAKELSKLGDIYINNAFATSHRKHASVNAIMDFLPSFAGELLTKEVKELSKKMKDPLILILGGLKLETKIDLLLHLTPRARSVLIGGGLAVSLLNIKYGLNLSIGSRELDRKEKALAKKVYNKVVEKIVLPVDVKVSSAKNPRKLVNRNIAEIRKGDKIYDIGNLTMRNFSEVLHGSKSVIWNGPMGYIEKKVATDGTLSVVNNLVGLKKTRVIVGGGETVAFLKKTGKINKIDFVSSGGGAMLSFLAGKEMPGLTKLITYN